MCQSASKCEETHRMSVNCTRAKSVIRLMMYRCYAFDIKFIFKFFGLCGLKWWMGLFVVFIMVRMNFFGFLVLFFITRVKNEKI